MSGRDGSLSSIRFDYRVNTYFSEREVGSKYPQLAFSLKRLNADPRKQKQLFSGCFLNHRQATVYHLMLLVRAQAAFLSGNFQECLDFQKEFIGDDDNEETTKAFLEQAVDFLNELLSNLVRESNKNSELRVYLHSLRESLISLLYFYKFYLNLLEQEYKNNAEQADLYVQFKSLLGSHFVELIYSNDYKTLVDLIKFVLGFLSMESVPADDFTKNEIIVFFEKLLKPDSSFALTKEQQELLTVLKSKVFEKLAAQQKNKPIRERTDSNASSVSMAISVGRASPIVVNSVVSHKDKVSILLKIVKGVELTEDDQKELARHRGWGRFFCGKETNSVLCYKAILNVRELRAMQGKPGGSTSQDVQKATNQACALFSMVLERSGVTEPNKKCMIFIENLMGAVSI